MTLTRARIVAHIVDRCGLSATEAYLCVEMIFGTRSSDGAPGIIVDALRRYEWVPLGDLGTLRVETTAGRVYTLNGREYETRPGRRVVFRASRKLTARLNHGDGESVPTGREW